MSPYQYNDYQSNNGRSGKPVAVIFIVTLLLIGVIVLVMCICNGVLCAPKEPSVVYTITTATPVPNVQPNMIYNPVVPELPSTPVPWVDPYEEDYGEGYDTPDDGWWYEEEEQYEDEWYGDWVEETPAPVIDPNTVMKKGAKGTDVALVQQRLIDLGYLDGAADGDFGSKTQAAVKWFQRQAGLTADGVVGRMTVEALFSDNAPYAQVVDVTDGGIPLLINRTHPVDEGFVPQNLVYLESYIPKGLCVYKISGLMAVREAADALIEMLQAAQADGLYDWQISEAYRTWDRQKLIFDTKVSEFMTNNGMNRSQASSATRKTVAEPGTSEHHSGLAFDITVRGYTFSDTKQYRWLKEHCWEYGFILRYTDDKESVTGFLGEEWHYRYVGREHAMRIHDMDMCLEEYVQYLDYAR
ncbi:MAG: hypothetical protein CW338_03240 [Clostridiales bacterium]|nr:hypothetical protein [Clostridiales bacterium]